MSEVIPGQEVGDSPEVAEIKELVPPSAKAKADDASTSNERVTFNTTAQMKERAPEVYKAMLEGIAANILGEMRDHQRRMKELYDEAKRDAGEY